MFVTQHFVNVQFAHCTDVVFVTVFSHVSSLQGFKNKFGVSCGYLAQRNLCVGGGRCKQVKQSVLVVSQFVLYRSVSID